ncbi:heme-binding protein [Fontimonas sp. SYSU GA230001]|uniref:GlcG/HbpS family heme-binding protein n=1 Tax=Fontimonas sp. SYSU GA230001 TaxID=3142450 RepID=UPI0032B614A3
MLLAGCSGGDRPSEVGTSPGVDARGRPCSGHCQTDNPQRLDVADVQRIIAQGVAEANARGRPATFVVIDRVGNVLAAYRMPGAPPRINVTSGIYAPTGTLISGGLDNVAIVPTELGSLAKALTAMYFSSEGNAFTSRTGGQVIQEHFNPGEPRTPGGALFGVQISQLPCSDISRRFNGIGPDPGPHRSAIGFGADPGGLPLYKQGVTVGAVGVIADGVYGVDKVITDDDRDADPDGNIDELIATAATFGFGAPRDRRADVITLEGKTARFADVDFEDLRTFGQLLAQQTPAFDPLPPLDDDVGLIAIRGYANAQVAAGTRFGLPESGIRAADTVTDAPGLAAADGFVIVDENNQNRFPARAGAGAGGLTKAEVEALLVKSVALANRARSQVRRPLGSSAGIHLVIVDINGDIVGAARTRDALVDAIDVNAQKARSALYFSKAGGAPRLAALPPAEYINAGPPAPGGVLPDPPTLRREAIGQYASNFRNFLGAEFGDFAFSTRAIGLIGRPFYPDNIDGNPPGPLSKPGGEWSIFSTGLQLDLVYNAVIRHLAFVLGVAPTDLPADPDRPLVGAGCTGYSPITDILDGAPEQANPIPEIRNGITLFAGGFPIYRGNQLIGAIGLSGDGLEQDDFLPFLAIDQVGKELGPGSINNAPQAIRADQLRPGGFDVNLRYVICPQSPFLDSDVQEVCNGL